MTDSIFYCDKEGYDYTSSRWEGEGFYRFMEPSGTMMPESSPETYHCGTGNPGWLNGHHSEEIGLEVEKEVCFASGSSSCGNGRVNIKVTNCGTYYVYYLVETPFCYLRYCAAKQN